jgi:hypothetical protein
MIAILALPAGCVVVDGKLDPKGGATFTLSHVVGDASEEKSERKAIEGPHVKVESDSFEKGRATYKLSVDDVTQLSTSKFFADTTVSLKDGEKAGTKDLTVTIHNKTTHKLPDKALETFGKEARITLEMPGDVVSSNATETKGRVLTWKFPTNDFLGRAENVLEATFKPSSAS